MNNKICMYITYNCMVLLKLQVLIYIFHYNYDISYDVISMYLEQNNEKLINYLIT